MSLILIFLAGCSHAPPPMTLLPIPVDVEAQKEGTHPHGFLERGLKSYSEGEYFRASTELETWMALNPNGELWPKYLLCYVYLSLGEYSKAAELSKEIERLDSMNPLAYEQAGLAYLWLGNYKEAGEHLDRALDFDSHAANTHFYRGIVYELNNLNADRDSEFTKAREEYEQILQSNAKDFTANFELASLLLYWNKSVNEVPILLQRARSTINTGLEEDVPLESGRRPFKDFYLPLAQGIFFLRVGESTKAEEELLKALNNSPSGGKADLAEVYLYLGKTLAMRGENEKANRFAERSLAMDPFGPYAKEASRLTQSK